MCKVFLRDLAFVNAGFGDSAKVCGVDRFFGGRVAAKSTGRGVPSFVCK